MISPINVVMARTYFTGLYWVRVSQTDVCFGFVLIGRRVPVSLMTWVLGWCRGGDGVRLGGVNWRSENRYLQHAQRGAGVVMTGHTNMFIEYKYQIAIDICSIYTIFTFTNCRWQTKVHIKYTKECSGTSKYTKNEHCFYKHASACIVVRSGSLFMNRYINVKVG